MLRERLKSQVGIGYFDEARRWLEMVLREERILFADGLLGRFNALLAQPDLTRRKLRVGVVSALQELREVQHYKPRRVYGWDEPVSSPAEV